MANHFRKLLKPFYRKVHPDAFVGAEPSKVKINSKAISILNSYIDSLNSGSEFPLQTLEFYLEKDDQKTKKVLLMPLRQGISDKWKESHMKNTVKMISEVMKEQQQKPFEHLADYFEYRKAKKKKFQISEETLDAFFYVKTQIDFYMMKNQTAENVQRSFYPFHPLNMGIQSRKTNVVVESAVDYSKKTLLFQKLNKLRFPVELLYFSPGISQEQKEIALNTFANPVLSIESVHVIFYTIESIRDQQIGLNISDKYSIEIPGFLTIPFNFEWGQFIKFYSQNKIRIKNSLKKKSANSFPQQNKFQTQKHINKYNMQMSQIDNFLRVYQTTDQKQTVKPQKQSKVQQHAKSSLHCKCSLCSTLYTQNPPSNWDTRHQTTLKRRQASNTQNFQWLLQQLGESSNQRLTSLNILDTVIFKLSKAVFWVWTSTQGKLKMSTSVQKLKNEQIRKRFSYIVRNRKNQGKNKHPQKYGRQIALVRYHYQGEELDSVLNTNTREGPFRVMYDSQFINLMYKRPSSNVWKTISYIQTVLKAPLGLGKSYLYNYYTPGIWQLQKQEDIGKQIEIKDMSNQEYFEKVCRRIACVLAICKNIHLVEMDAEFVSDDDGVFWFFYSSFISIQKIPFKTNEADQVDRITAQLMKQNQELVPITQPFIKKPLVRRGEIRIQKRMSSYFHQIKEKRGLNRLFQSLDSCRNEEKDNKMPRFSSPTKVFVQPSIIRSKSTFIRKRMIGKKSAKNQVIISRPHWQYNPLMNDSSKKRFFAVQGPFRQVSKLRSISFDARAVSPYKNRLN